MRLEHSIKNTIYGFCKVVSQLLCKFGLRTVFIYVLGKEFLGLDGLFLSIIQVLSLAELGFGAAISYGLYKPIAENNTYKISALMNLYRKIYFIVGIIILVAGIAICPFVKVFITGEYPDVINIYVVFLIFLMNTVVGYFFSYKRSLIYAAQRSDIESKVGSLFLIGLTIVQVSLLLIFKSYYAYIIIMPVFTFSENLIISIIANKKFPNLDKKARLNDNDRKHFSKDVKAMIFHKIGGVAVFSTDNIIMASFIGLAIVGMYSNYYLLISAVAAFITTFVSALTASIGDSVAKESVEKNYATFKKLSFINYWIIGFSLTCFIVLMQPFISIWIGDDYLFSFGIMVAIVISFALQQSRNIIGSYRTVTGVFYNDRYKPILEAGVNLIASLVLVQFMGVAGVILGTIISHIFVAIPIEVYTVYKNYFKKSPVKYFLVYILVAAIIGAVCYLVYMLCSLITVNSLLMIFVKLAICIVCTNGIYALITFKTGEFKYFVRLIKQLLKKLFKKNIREEKELHIEKTELDGVLILTPKVFGDNRGWFTETYSRAALEKEGIVYNFIQDNQSFSAEKGTLRGLHFQNHPYAQTKLVRCTRGSIVDVAVDIRAGSPTYKKFVKVELSSDNKKQLLIPKGFAHGFLTLTEDVEVQYKVDNDYSPQCDRSVKFDDPDMGVDWGIETPILSDKDKNAPLLKDCDCNFSKKVLVTGFNGQLGYDVIKKLKEENFECLGSDINDFDITDIDNARTFITNYKPDVIVHCAAYTAVDKAESEKELCFKINSEGSRNLATLSKEVNAEIIYVSTDYVYDGEGIKPFSTNSLTNPLSTYGKSKLEGEKAVAEINDKHFIIRTSWVFGKNGNNFVKTMLKLAKEKDKLSVVSDQIGSPTYTVDLANLIFEMINSKAYGTYNASNEGFTSWYDFAREIFVKANIDIQVDKVLTADYKTAAVRPLNSRLDKSKLIESGFKRLPVWEDALDRYLKEIL